MRKQAFLFFVLCTSAYAQCVDPIYKDQMELWNASGVKDGIPTDHSVYSMITPVLGSTIHSSVNGDTTLQAELKAATLVGGRQKVVLHNGIYPIDHFDIPSNVLLMGENIDSTIIKSTFRNSRTSIDEAGIVEIQDGTVFAGIENLTIDYTVLDCHISDYEGKDLHTPNTYQSSYYTNTPCDRTDLEVTGIEIRPNASNCWVRNVKINNIGSTPMKISGDNNTVDNCYFKGAYMKGTNGQGYFEINGDGNRIIGNTFHFLRHVVLQKYNGAVKPNGNVLFNNLLYGCDYNIHDDEDGDNLFEQNEVRQASWSAWGPYHTGHACCHQVPDISNWLVNNKMYNKQNISEFSDTDVVYKSTGKFKGRGEEGLEDSGKKMSACGYFFTDETPRSQMGFVQPLMDR
ncbi:MAG: hypothetical protein AAFZ89_14495 [Bacteroidota bacterium]